LPGAGRDEATYAYWSQHPEAAYSPLLQLFVKIFSWIPLPEIFQLRLTSIIAGTLAILLCHRFLKYLQVEVASRIAAIAALGLSPWMTYTGSILHPDMLLLCCILAFLIMAFQQQLIAASIFAGLAFWAKLSGLVVLPAALFLLWKNREQSGITLVTSGLILVLLIGAILSQLKPDLVMAIAEFGRMDPSIGFLKALLIQVGYILFLGGPAIVLGFIAGIWQYREITENYRQVTNLQRYSALIVASVIAAFGLAMLVTQQVKGNWLLPGLLLLWPAVKPKLFRPAILLSILSSVFIISIFAFPEVVKDLEKKVPIFAASYSVQAGAREARVSPTRSWSERSGEYQNLSAFATAVAEKVDMQKTQWLMSDDYGLAAQLIREWGRADMQMIIPGDRLFYRSEQQFAKDVLQKSTRVIVIGVQKSLKDLTEGKSGLRA
ncbi:MAG: glycosyltransferase family 39 protein, partial [Calditrichota bacterium]